MPKPDVFVQWKGTDVCCDVNCECGASFHYDGYFMYFVRCSECGAIYEVGTRVPLTKIDAAPDQAIVIDLE